MNEGFLGKNEEGVEQVHGIAQMGGSRQAWELSVGAESPGERGRKGV